MDPTVDDDNDDDKGNETRGKKRIKTKGGEEGEGWCFDVFEVTSSKEEEEEEDVSTIGSGELPEDTTGNYEGGEGDEGNKRKEGGEKGIPMMIRIEGTIGKDGSIILDLEDSVRGGFQGFGEDMDGVEDEGGEGEDSNSEGWYGNDYPEDEDGEEGGWGGGSEEEEDDDSSIEEGRWRMEGGDEWGGGGGTGGLNNFSMTPGIGGRIGRWGGGFGGGIEGPSDDEEVGDDFGEGDGRGDYGDMAEEEYTNYAWEDEDN
ncbi:hypothetical protein TrCOL_g5592 [Triparma columacea]|uniref:Transcription factor Iwr1 domain-containing protein n=1 Tax=Triparma columacea TaxID=722753 RepID=A0A9W7FYZ1_9STRA|nr:hypothetical protein TrCOL_g5592 [Triparma columacea]